MTPRRRSTADRRDPRLGGTMFSTLLGTRPVRARTRSAVIISFVVHVALAGTAIAATKMTDTDEPAGIEKIPDIIFVPPKPETPAPQRAQTPEPEPPRQTDPAPAPSPLPPLDVPTTVPT